MDESETPLSPTSRRALEVFREQTSPPLPPAHRDGLWRSAVVAAQPARNQLVLKAFVLSVSILVGGVVVTALMGTRQPEIQPSQTAQWKREGDAVTVQRGQLRVMPRGKRALAVATPQLQAVVQNAAVLFDVSADGSTVLSVESGEVTWRAHGKSGVLVAGKQLTMKPPPPPPALTVAPGVPAVESCRQGEGYETCLADASQGSGLAAQTALYALGMLAHERADFGEATELFRAYGDRFPDGVFAPEASIALMVDLAQQGKAAEARAEAARFGAQFAGEPRAADVARWAQQIP